VTFPPAEGRRLEWAELPQHVRDAVEQRLGAPVVDARSQPGGFSPGVAARLTCASGSRAFVKAVSGAQNPESPAMHRREARIAAALPRSAPAPELLWTFDDGDWVVLGFEDLDGTTPELPWRRDELDRVLAAVHDMAVAMTPSPIALEPASTELAALFTGWRSLACDTASHGDQPWITHLDELIELEAAAPQVTEGDSLVHLDVRADNIVLTDDAVYIVDWPWAAMGAAWIDLAAMLPSVAMQGGPDPETIWRTHPVQRGVPSDDVDAFVAGLAGFFAHASTQAPTPGLPTLRAFQAAHATTAYAWLATRRRWTS
jgi:aminoglycoside phosphotransferase (APT) family kinase protein